MIKSVSSILFLTLLGFSIGLNSQNKSPLEAVLLKGFLSTDSSEVYFASARKLIKTQADSANYLYFKAFKTQSLSQRDSAMYYFDRAIPLLKEVDSLNRLRKSYNQYHYLNLDQGNYEQALEYTQKALSIAEKLRDTANISLHLSDIGNIYHEFEDYKKGIIYGKKAFAVMNSASKKVYKYLIFANNIIGINFDDWKKPDSALFYHYKNLEFLDYVEDTLRFSFVLNNIGNTLLKQKKYSKAKKYLMRALVMDKINENNYSLTSDYTNLATIAYNENQNVLAEQYFKEAENYAKKSGSLEKVRDLTLQQAWFYKKIGDFKKAYEFQEQFFVLRDSVFNKERAGKIAEMEAKYETEKKEKDLAQSRAYLAESELKIKQKNIFIYGMIALALFVGVVGFLVYRQQKLKNNQLQKEADLKTALAKIETQNQLQEQRLRISRDLHDNIGSQLTFIISSIDTLKMRLTDVGSEVTTTLAAISNFTSQTIYELRDTIWAMNKTEISIEDLQTRILNFIEKAKISSDVNFQFRIDKDLLTEKEFTSVQGMNIYRIMQEAVNNALKYADATEILVLLSQPTLSIEKRMNHKSSFMMEIKDDGKGFNFEKSSFGNGLENIKKRANDLGGTVTINSNVGSGTTLQLIC